MPLSVLLLSTLLAFAPWASATSLPIVLWHGMGDTAANPISLGRIERLIEDTLPGTFVYSVMIGATVEEDMLNGFFMNVNKQIDVACATLATFPQLANGFDAIGFSQGGQFLRGVVQRCAFARVRNLVSIGGQHQGVFGLPKCVDLAPYNQTLCELARKVLDLGIYTAPVQAISTQANYWHDPLNTTEYLQGSGWLADINGANAATRPLYAKRLLALRSLVLVLFLNDTMVMPRESEHFGFFVEGQDRLTVNLTDTPVFQQNWLPLSAMLQAGQLVFLSTIGEHLQFTDQWFVANILQRLG